MTFNTPELILPLIRMMSWFPASESLPHWSWVFGIAALLRRGHTQVLWFVWNPGNLIRRLNFSANFFGCVYNLLDFFTVYWQEPSIFYSHFLEICIIVKYLVNEHWAIRFHKPCSEVVMLFSITLKISQYIKINTRSGDSRVGDYSH